MPRTRTRACLVAVVALVIGAASVARAQRAVPRAAPTAPKPARTAPLLGDQTDGSRARPVHRISLRDPEGEVIRPTDRPLLPFSTIQTCGADCHDVAAIAHGWHFNVAAKGPSTVRPGEPWILTDPATATQVPLSYHRWPGAFTPEQLGLTPWSFAKLFGGRIPGGLAGGREPGPELRTRWIVSGDLEPDCLACHDASPGYDHAEYGRLIAQENFRWAAAGASGLAVATGAGKEMPNSFDYLLPSVEDSLLPQMPSIAYAGDRFLPGAKVVLDIVRDVPARRCYFCHTAVDVRHTGQGRWSADADIHLARGMTCVDCHRNGLDHDMSRGYETTGPGASASCRGCHLAAEPERVFARGRLGAPYPRHEGLPPVHLEKLSCTVCHSGPLPAPAMRQLKTSLAHRLGGLNVNKAVDALPHLYDPVFVRQDDGVMTPNRVMWPAYWGAMAKGSVRPFAPERVSRVMAKAKIAFKRPADGGWPTLDGSALASVLVLLQKEAGPGEVPVYVSGGNVHRLATDGGIAAEAHPAAQPYLWPIAHDVRPASLALGARGCQDCHDVNAPIFFGQVPVDSPLAADRAEPWKMSRFQKNLDATYVADFARVFRYRAWLKGVVAGAGTLLALIALAYALLGLARISGAANARRWMKGLVTLGAFGACVVSVASAWPALLSGQTLTGYRLIAHVGAAPVLAAGATLVALFWAHANALAREDWNRLRRPFGEAARHGATPYIVVLRKASFWIAVAAAITAIASAALTFFPLLASVRQAAFFAVHRFAAVTLASSGLVFMCCAFAAWLGGRAKITARADTREA